MRSIKLKLFALLLALNVSVTAFADTIQGYDALLLARYCSEYLRAPHLPGLGILLNTGGNPLPCVEEKQKRQPLRLVQVDLIDATCWRNRKCPAGAPRPDDLREIERRAASVRPLAEKYPGTEFSLSPALEHDVKDGATVVRMLQAAKKGCPSCTVINSPFSGATPAGYNVERHGTLKVRAYSISGDGKSSFDGDTLNADTPDGKGNGFNHAQAGSYSTFGWFDELNLRCTGESVFTAPLKRTNRPTAAQFWQLWKIFQPEELRAGPPPQCKRVHEVNGGEIVKPNAEAYCNGEKDDGRGNKPMLILRKSAPVGTRLNVLARNGKRIGCFQSYGRFTDPKFWRWYMGNCSKQNPQQLFKAAGGEWAFVELGRGECLRINTIRRMGVYR